MQFSICFSSTKDQNWEFLGKILDMIGVKYTTRRTKDKRGESSRLEINDSMSIYKTMSYIYLDSEGIRLERKYNKFIEFMNYKSIHNKHNNLFEIANDFKKEYLKSHF